MPDRSCTYIFKEVWHEKIFITFTYHICEILSPFRRREYLTDYSERLVNKPFYINGYCNSETIGKYSWVGGHANKNSPVGEFNKPNVCMVDKYNSSSPFWVSVDYDPVQGKWVQTAVTDFTTFNRNLNKPQRNEGATVASMDDEACLSK